MPKRSAKKKSSTSWCKRKEIAKSAQVPKEKEKGWGKTVRGGNSPMDTSETKDLSKRGRVIIGVVKSKKKKKKKDNGEGSRHKLAFWRNNRKPERGKTQTVRYQSHKKGRGKDKASRRSLILQRKPGEQRRDFKGGEIFTNVKQRNNKKIEKVQSMWDTKGETMEKNGKKTNVKKGN